ncbi:MAG: hypothetical protein J5I50_07700 [Chitinophagaceae bacterium]|nr:hypothetical protein [Chitinophagaceae bacterium]
MKNKKVIIRVLWILMVIWGCSAGSNDRAAAQITGSEDTEVQNADKSWQQILAEKTPLDKEELYKLFPENLGGYPLIRITDADGFNGAIGTYSGEKETGPLNTYITLTIIDGAGYQYFQHINAVNNTLESGYSQKDAKGYERIETVNGLKMAFVDRQIGDRTTSDITFIKGRRYQVQLGGNRMTTENLWDPAVLVQGLQFPD